jgi:hypothetical protein
MAGSLRIPTPQGDFVGCLTSRTFRTPLSPFIPIKGVISILKGDNHSKWMHSCWRSVTQWRMTDP